MTVSARLNALAWLLVAVGAALLPISLVSLLMISVPHYGDGSAGVVGLVSVVFGPITVLAAGLGLLKRKRWAPPLTIALSALLLADNVVGMLQGPTLASSTIDAAGVIQTRLASDAPYSPLLMLLSFAVMVLLLGKAVRQEFAHARGVTEVVGLPVAARPES